MSDYYDYSSSWDDWSYWSDSTYSYDDYSSWDYYDDYYSYNSYTALNDTYDNSWYQEDYYIDYSWNNTSETNYYDTTYFYEYDDYYWNDNNYAYDYSAYDEHDATFDYGWGYSADDWYDSYEYYTETYYDFNYDYYETAYSYSQDYYYSWDFYVTPAPVIEVIYTMIPDAAGTDGSPIAWTEGLNGFAGTIHQAFGYQAYGSWAGTIQGSGHDDTIIALGAWTEPGTSIAGGAGADVLVASGQGGGTTLAGNSGADQFIVDFRHDPWAAVSGWAQISDFNPAQGDSVTLLMDAGHDPLFYAVDTAYGLDVVVDSGDGFFDLYFTGQTAAHFDPAWIALA